MSWSEASRIGAPDDEELRRSARAVLESHWREPGFTCPNGTTYPWLWLWDSCFHSIVWAELGEPDRAVSELRTALEGQGPSGFVPHLRYLDGNRSFDEFWRHRSSGGAPSTSSITQPPVYALTVVDLVRRGIEVPDELVPVAAAPSQPGRSDRARAPVGVGVRPQSPLGRPDGAKGGGPAPEQGGREQ